MLTLTRWCIRHRKTVIIGWIAIAVITTFVAGAIGRQYATNFSLPGTEAQRAFDLLNSEFKSQSGDVDTIVFHVANGTVESPQVRSAIDALLTKVARDPHVVSVLSPYAPHGAVEISPDHKTAFATLNYSKRAADLP